MRQLAIYVSYMTHSAAGGGGLAQRLEATTGVALQEAQRPKSFPSEPRACLWEEAFPAGLERAFARMGASNLLLKSWVLVHQFKGLLKFAFRHTHLGVALT